MKPEVVARCKEIISDVRNDCELDAVKLDGRPITGDELATIFSETIGMIHGLAGVVEKILEAAVADGH